MLSFRYHIASLVAVLLALAAGVALGGGPLKDIGRGTSDQQLASARSALATQRARAADLQQQAVLAQRFAATVGPQVVAGKLAGHTVSLVLLPGADPQVVSGLQALLHRAGAQPGATLVVQPKTTQAANRQLVDALTSQLAAQEKDVPLPSTLSTYQRLGALMARVAGTTTHGGAAYDATAVSILAGLDTAGLVKAQGQPPRRGDLLLVVAGNPDTEADSQAAPTIEETVADGLTRGVRVVVVGPTSSAARGGVIEEIRGGSEARQVSTVDSADTGAGQVASVLALVRAAAGQIGSYGVVGDVDAPLPGVPGTPAATS